MGAKNIMPAPTISACGIIWTLPIKNTPPKTNAPANNKPLMPGKNLDISAGVTAATAPINKYFIVFEPIHFVNPYYSTSLLLFRNRFLIVYTLFYRQQPNKYLYIL
jgi:hypothetical protein